MEVKFALLLVDCVGRHGNDPPVFSDLLFISRSCAEVIVLKSGTSYLGCE